jgi:hypothetical protein
MLGFSYALGVLDGFVAVVTGVGVVYLLERFGELVLGERAGLGPVNTPKFGNLIEVPFGVARH